jgi:GNAT superfamily N-acetyltransferase
MYYIMVISTDKEFRGQGYATKLLNGFVEKVKEETKTSPKKVSWYTTCGYNYRMRVFNQLKVEQSSRIRYGGD